MMPPRGCFYPINGYLNVKKENQRIFFEQAISPEKQGLACYAAECGTFTVWFAIFLSKNVGEFFRNVGEKF
jgi:hypothetical protein